MSDEIPFSKKDQRKLSPFLGHELLYDYLSRKLDVERMKAMDQVVSENREIQDEIQSLNSAMNYVEHLSETDIAEVLLNQVRQPTSYIQGLLQRIRFQEWPQGLKLGFEVLIVTFCLSMAAIFMPWYKLAQWSNTKPAAVTLTEIKNEFNTEPKGENELPLKNAPSDPQVAQQPDFQDENIKNPAAVVAATPAPSPAPQVKATPVPAAKVPEVAAKFEPVTTKEESTAGKHQGWLYRGNISVVNLDASTEKFVAKITELGGRKAGEVDLGWKKEEGTYFHFTIPEAKYEELVDYLNEYGQLKISKEKHERLMPDGIIRLIVTVSESKKKSP